MPDKSVERVSRDRVALAPKPPSPGDILEALRPLTTEELTPPTWPLPAETGLSDIPHTGTVRPSSDTSDGPSVATTPANSGPALPPDGVPPVTSQGTSSSPDVTHDTPAADTHTYVVDRVVAHGVCDDASHPSAKLGETIFRTRWYGFDSSQDTWEPITHLPRGKVLSYFRRKKLPVPENIGMAVDG